ncbi:MAG: protein phosphatase 2C domain-containing protein [Myxococcales bacterium]|nr:protein phosphatase 2C domain-containing protein [Polyangiaceae bacterium]MDW8250756.1 protein phosphatase 2C domain-containing protein [Myxococcales bacterium]
MMNGARVIRSRSSSCTDIGRYRTVNQDALLSDDTLGLYVVADGMGGHAAGEIASHEAVENVFGMVKRGLRNMPELRGHISEQRLRAACRMMEGAIQSATYMLFAMAEFDRSKSGMGTTISALLLLGYYGVFAQVGDSRIYQIREGRVAQLTEDHTLIGWQLKQGLISPEEANRSPHKNIIIRAVGNRDYVQVDTGLVDLMPGDRYLLCSDGLHGYLQNEEIPLLVSEPLSSVSQTLVDLANARGGRDNITAIVVETFCEDDDDTVPGFTLPEM